MTVRILNVDDDEAGRYVTGRLLRHAGFEVIEAGTGQQGLELTRSSRPDLILLDVNLPDVSGHEVCATLRADPEFANLPVLMLSASSVTGRDRVRGLIGGADAYMAEPADPEELVAVINALLRMRRAEGDVVELNRALKSKVQELETTIDTLPIGLAIASDPECVNVRGNAAMATIAGVAMDRNFSRDAGNESAYVVRANGVEVDMSDLPLRRAARGETVRNEEHEIVRADGTSVFVYGHASPLFDADGNLNGAVGAFMDITERKAADARQRLLADMTGLLAEALDIDKTLTGTARVAVRHLADWCVIDAVQPDGKLHRAAAVHRDPERQSLADALRDRHGSQRNRSAALYRVLESGKPVLANEISEADREAFRRDPDLDAILDGLGMRSYISAPLTARGRSLGVITLVRAAGRPYNEADLPVVADLASRAALALDNAILFSAAEEANRAKDAFFAMVSHELRTPLTSIMGWATMLTKRDVDSDTRRTGLGEIHRSAMSQARIIEDLLDTARIAAGKLHLDFQRVSLDNVVQQSVMLVQQAAAEKKIEIRSRFEPLAIVQADQQRLVQIASNLLTNALKFTPAHGTIDIGVMVDIQAGNATLAVRDTGRGISAEFLPHVFERFAQEEDSSGGMGLGLGLNIVKSFVELHGGQVSVASDGEGAGSEFRVSLPLAAPGNEPAE
jgi:signal transduction histidine kinase/DNA-binding response OmpR family regulator